MRGFSVHYDPDALEGLSHISPFNLKNDIKTSKITIKELEQIAEELANELMQIADQHKNSSFEYITRGRDAAWIKIRISDSKRQAGKSNGYRSILLVDLFNRHAFILHIYRHGHGEDKNISQNEKNKLRDLVDKYSKALENLKDKRELMCSFSVRS